MADVAGQSREDSEGAPLASGVGALVVAAAALLALLHVVWLIRFRFGYVTDWDEAGYISNALSYLQGLGDGPSAFVDAVGHSLGTQPPVVPLSAVPLLGLFGRSVDVAQLAMPIWSLALVLATYGLARQLMPARWAALAALCLGSAPVVADYSRLFHFAVPAAALLTAALWAVLRSDGLRRMRWVVAAGVLLALMLTARTMTVSYLPGVAIGAGLPLIAGGADRRVRVRNFAVLWLVALGIAALWWVPVWGTVTNYLRSAGYGAEATGYGGGASLLSLDWWTTEIQVLGNYLQLALALALLAGLLAGGAFALRRPLRPRSSLDSPALLPAVVVVEGYLALSSTSNQGTGFALPWIPALVVLALGAAASVPARPLRVCLAGLLLAVCVLNLAVKNGVSERLSEPRLVDVPLIGDVTLTDGRDFVYAALDAYGYPVRPPPARLPEEYKEWASLNERLVAVVAPGDEEASVTVGTGDYLINETRLELASRLERRRGLELGLIRPPATLGSYRRQLAAENPDALILSEPARRPLWPVNPLLLAGAAQRSGARETRRLRAPDGRQVFVWTR
jgi:4-amino-4-deoxy-L-arabinose transferase-like glycosyltransferase